MHTDTYRRFVRSLPWAAALLLFWLAASAWAQDEVDPPGRVAHMSLREGGVVFAPQGEDEWIDLPQNRPLTRGDRLWTDRGARAELHLGTAVLHVGDESHLGLSELDDRSARLLLQQGTLNARVRDLTQGENFEIGTPNLALRVQQPGDYRIDVAPDGRETRVVVHSGLATVFGEGGESLQLRAGQQAAFAGRALAQVRLPAQEQDDFDAWAAARNRAEDQAIAARYVPRGVVGATQLDAYGTWSQDPGLGAVWYPQVTVQDWAPYRYGRWEWISPWGWTWIDDAPWGFAPFHYGRWTMIANRWAWVPGRLAARPVYAPALVVFLGGGPSVGWYPLAPGEAWWPSYRSSPRYVSFANFNIDLNRYPRHYADHVWRQRPRAFTAVREDDFRRGRPVYRHRQALQPDAGGIRIGAVPARPEWRREREDRDAGRGTRTAPRLQAAPPAALQPGAPRFWGGRDEGGRDFGRGEGDGRDGARRDIDRRDFDRRAVDRRDFGGRELPPAVRDQARAQREQERLQHDAEREARRQQREAAQGRRQDELRQQREQQLRQQQDAFRQQQESVRRQQDAWRQQQQAAREQHERAQRAVQERRLDAAPPRQRDRDGWQRGEERMRPEPQRRWEQQPRAAARGGDGAREGRAESRGEGRGEGRRQRDDGEGRARGLQYQR